MITLITLAKALETKLNEGIASGEYFINKFTANEHYLFNIVLDQGEYKKATRSGNVVTKYINGVINLTSDQKAGITEDTLTAEISASLDLVIPGVDKKFDVTDVGGVLIKTVSFADAVRELVDDTLSEAEQEYMREDSGAYYLVTTSYSFANSGILDTRYQVGDSTTLTLFIDYSIVAAGVSAANIEMYVGGSRIYPTRLDIVRTSVQEGVILSEDMVSKTTTQATQFTIGINKPLRFDEFDSYALEFIMHGKSRINLEPITLPVVLKYPKNMRSGGEIATEQVSYTLSFAEASMAGELNLAVPISATLHEEVTIYG